MVRSGIFLLLTLLVPSDIMPAPDAGVTSVCELSKDFPAFRDKVVTVRGVYYYGLREECPQKCADGMWPSFIDLEGADDATWADLAKAEREVESEAKVTGKRLEVWVTVVGRLQTRAKPSPLGPCDRKRQGLGYGHLNAFPARITVESFRNIEIRVNPHSSYDYANMYHGPA
jgi:hypothetical protein